MFFVLAVLLAMEVTSSGVGPPNVEGFSPILSKELEFRVDDYKTAFVGQVVVYQNPDDPNEFVRVYYRQVAIVSGRPQDNNGAEVRSRDTNLSNFKYHSKREKETLGRVHQASDAFAYVQWRTVRDLRTGQDVREGPFRSWLLEQNGNWMVSSAYNLLDSPFSEPSKADPKKRIVVGIKFTLVGGTHIVRIDQDDILASTKEADSDQK